MEFFIRIKDGHPFEHPILGDNFRQAFPDVDTNNLPPEFSKFLRVETPILGPYEKNQTVSYQLVDNVYTDVFACEQMTAEEIAVKQQKVKDAWVAHNGFPSWSFDETLCKYIPPVPKPTDGKPYYWDEPTLTWIETT
jgi:hypothetical protein